MTLYVSSDANDTNFTFKVIDGHPDGKAYNIIESIHHDAQHPSQIAFTAIPDSGTPANVSLPKDKPK